MFNINKQDDKYNIYVNKKLVAAFSENALEQVFVKYNYSININQFCNDLNIREVFSFFDLPKFLGSKFSEIREIIGRKYFSRDKVKLSYGEIDGVTAADLILIKDNKDKEFAFRVSIEKFMSSMRQRGERFKAKDYMEYVKRNISESIIALKVDFESLDDSMLLGLHYRLRNFVKKTKQRYKAATQPISLESENDSSCQDIIDLDEAIDLIDQTGDGVLEDFESVDCDNIKDEVNEEYHREGEQIENEMNTKAMQKQTKNNVKEFDVKKVDDSYIIYINGEVFISITENALLLCFEKFDYSVDMNSFINEMSIEEVHSYPNLAKYLRPKFYEIRESLARKHLMKKKVKIAFREIDKVDVADVFIHKQVTFRISIPKFIQGIRQRGGGSLHSGNYLQHVTNNISSSIISSSSDLMTIDSLTLVGLHIRLQYFIKHRKKLSRKSKRSSSPDEFELENVSLSENDQEDEVKEEVIELIFEKTQQKTKRRKRLATKDHCNAKKIKKEADDSGTTSVTKRVLRNNNNKANVVKNIKVERV